MTTEPDAQRIADQLRAQRVRCRLSQSEVGARLRPPRTHAAVSDIERGKTHLTVPLLMQFADIYGVAIDINGPVMELKQEAADHALAAAQHEIGRLTLLASGQTVQYSLWQQVWKRRAETWEAERAQLEAACDALAEIAGAALEYMADGWNEHRDCQAIIMSDSEERRTLRNQNYTLRTAADGLAGALETIERDYLDPQCCPRCAIARNTMKQALIDYRSRSAPRGTAGESIVQ
jgi:transcriptional regulator with XRE-family HTH domain